MTEQVAPASLTPVEAELLRRSGRSAARYPGELADVLEVDSVPALGLAAAARFLEWASEHPTGLLTLPTGRTPEHFIRQVKRLRASWAGAETQAELVALGLRPGGAPPDLSRLVFVQMDEFYPMDPSAANSFNAYVRREYLTPAFGLDPAKALLIDTWQLGCPPGVTSGELFAGGVDLSLRLRPPASPREAAQAAALRAVDSFCCAYERALDAAGGLGFVLGGLGPDGHVAFNCRGSDHFSTTRLCGTNYETQAAAAGDLGGVEAARRGAVVTLGLRSLTRRRDAAALLFAAGDAKAPVCAAAVAGEAGLELPASALRSLPFFCLLLTRSAASRLPQRALADFAAAVAGGLACGDARARAAMHEVSLAAGLPLLRLTPEHLRASPRAALLLAARGAGEEEEADEARCTRLAAGAHAQLATALELGLRARPSASFLHTAPHHDDIALGYLAKAAHEVEAGGRHLFAYATSGFNAVTNAHAAGALRAAAEWLDARGGEAGDAFAPTPGGYDSDASAYLDASAARDAEAVAAAAHARTLRIVAAELAGQPGVPALSGAEVDAPWRHAAWLAAAARAAAAYFGSQPPGGKDARHMQALKGAMREFECDLLWAAHGFRPSLAVRHLRLGFYKGDFFTEDPQATRDVAPLLSLMRERRPDVVTVALDPEGSGPDTHFKVLQAVAAAVKAAAGDDAPPPRVWGYRNVWCRFSAAEAGLIFPVTPSDAAALGALFTACCACGTVRCARELTPRAVRTQRAASFPAPEHDGPFSELAEMVQAAQFRELRTLLGEEFFEGHPSARVRAARGALFLAEMGADEFLARVRSLGQATDVQ